MGQGYSLTTLSAGAAGIDVPELADLAYERSLGNARFMKSIRARHKDGLVVAKVVMRPYPELKLDKYVKALIYERKLLTDVPNALGYHRVVETSTNGYLVRQYIHSSLYDRMSTRPFLEDIEKKWLAFQLLCAVRDCHARNIYHGDIKTENILVTSWNWLYLSDFSSSFKPAYLPEDNPADFSFYFDNSGRRTCYLAPERFLSTGSQPDAQSTVNWAMDIFSVGCVIAELFLETPIFTLSQLFKYRQGEYDPELAQINKINDKDVRELVLHMIQLDPNSRYAADEYLNFWRGRTFPEYFHSFLHQYMYMITDPSAGRKPITAGGENLGESDDRIDTIYNDFDKISYFLGSSRDDQDTSGAPMVPKSVHPLFPLHIDIPNYRHQARANPSREVDDGTLIFLTLVVVSLRSTARAASRIRACELLLAFAERSTDEAKFDRITPYLIGLLNDKSDSVKVAALRTLTQLMAMVTVVSPGNVYIFPEYILPRLQPFIPGSSSKPSRLLRMTYAACLASLATTASRFLDMMQALRADGLLPTTDPQAEVDSMSHSTYQNLFDVARADLVSQFEGQITALLTDDDSAVKRAFLGSVASLCVFFGTPKANDIILSHLNTYLNDKDWMLKCAFFETIVGVATYVGSTSLEEFILPLMVQALTDPEEFVVERVLRSLSAMAELGLFQRSRTWELIDIASRFTMHPNIWIREAAAQFISATATYISVADTYSIMLPLIKPYLKVLPSSISELKLLDSLKKPLPRIVLEQATRWALQAEKSAFWKPAKQQRSFNFGLSEDATTILPAKDLGPKSLSKVAKTEEDELWLAKLRTAGMYSDDESKLLALREYIWRVSHRASKVEDDKSMAAKLGQIYPLKDAGINPQTVFFDHQKDLLDQGQQQVVSASQEDEKHHRTIADALLDAQTTVEDPISRRKLSHLNAHANRLAVDSVQARQSSTPTPSVLSSSPVEGQGSRRPSIDISSRQSSYRQQKDSPVTSPAQLSPVGSLGALTGGEPSNTVKRKGSAIGLLNRGETGSKALAETSMSSENAFGKTDGHNKETAQKEPSSKLAAAQEQQKAHPEVIKYQAAHSYVGNDPTVLKLLDTLYLDTYPVDDVEFGPTVKPVSAWKAAQNNTQAPPGPTRPEGTMVAMIGEHTGAITRVVVSPDHAFFLTGSEDGTVRVWDSARLERNVAHRSRQTYKLSEGVKVTSLSFVKNTYSFIAAGSDSSVHVVRVDHSHIQGSSRYGKFRVLRQYQLDEGEYAVWTDHYKTDTSSVMILATNTSRIVAVDLRTMREIFVLRNPLHHGTPTCFAIDPKSHYLLLGTSHGVLDLWDLRFRLRLRAWGMAGASPVHRLAMQAVRGKKGVRVFVAGGTGQPEVTVWDLERALCTEVYRTGLARDSTRGMSLADVDDERPGGMLGRFATALEPGGAAAGTDRGIQALALSTVVAREGSEPRQVSLVTAGPDWKVRFWDSSRPEASMVVSGLELEEQRPAYAVSHPFPETTLVAEQLAQPPPGSAAASSASGSAAAQGGRTPSSARKGGTKPPRSSIISQQQQHLLRSHLDVITDVALLEYPCPMMVSVDRAGVIFVFQ